MCYHTKLHYDFVGDCVSYNIHILNGDERELLCLRVLSRGRAIKLCNLIVTDFCRAEVGQQVTESFFVIICCRW
jgi:hypothetical protein